jgi:hypothetical protein
VALNTSNFSVFGFSKIKELIVPLAEKLSILLFAIFDILFNILATS